jgi:sRNA-binding carbon storage regulator CsrA
MLVLSKKIKGSITLHIQESVIAIFIEGIRGKQLEIDVLRSIHVARTELLTAFKDE